MVFPSSTILRPIDIVYRSGSFFPWVASFCPIRKKHTLFNASPARISKCVGLLWSPGWWWWWWQQQETFFEMRNNSDRLCMFVRVQANIKYMCVLLNVSLFNQISWSSYSSEDKTTTRVNQAQHQVNRQLRVNHRMKIGWLDIYTNQLVGICFKIRTTAHRAVSDSYLLHRAQTRLGWLDNQIQIISNHRITSLNPVRPSF